MTPSPWTLTEPGATSRERRCLATGRRGALGHARQLRAYLSSEGVIWSDGERARQRSAAESLVAHLERREYLEARGWTAPPQGRGRWRPPVGGAARTEAEELVRRGSLFCTASEYACSVRARRVSLLPVELDLPWSILRVLWRIEDGDLQLPALVPDVAREQSPKRRQRPTVRVSWSLLEGALWRALVERVRLHLEQGRRLLELWPLPGWSWDEVREAACAAREGA